MFNKNSVYAQNKRDAEAIVCPDILGEPQRLTKEAFISEEEFLFWKRWSDENYHEWDNGDVTEAKHTVSLFETSDPALAIPDPEERFILYVEQMERGKTSAELVSQIRGILTERQFRRLWLYCVEGLTQEIIARHEAVGQQRISVSIAAAKKRLKKFFQQGKSRGKTG